MWGCRVTEGGPGPSRPRPCSVPQLSRRKFGQEETVLARALSPVSARGHWSASLVFNISFANNSAFNYVRLKMHAPEICGVLTNVAETTQNPALPPPAQAGFTHKRPGASEA